MNGAEVLTKFTADTSGVNSATKSVSASLGQLTKAFTLGNLAGQAISKTLNVMTSNLDSAITRYDTMNNFPRVMSNLGIATEDANEVVKDLSEQLVGLPTALDTATMAVQRFTSSNGDVKQSEKMFLAVNNAILAGGANAQIQANALEQISQAYAKGKPDMMEWRTMLTAMPAQMKQVATAMGYINVADLGEDLRKGNVSMNQFIDTIVKLNSEGLEGFASFEEQARSATGGISTSIKNMKTAVIRGITSMITKVNEGLEPFGGLNGVITEVGKIAESIFTKIGEIIAFVIPKVIEFANWFDKYGVILTPLVGIIASIVTALKTYSIIMGVINTLQAIQNALLLANPVVLIIAAVIAAITAVIAIVILLYNKCEWFRNLVNLIFNYIKMVISTIINIVKAVIDLVVGYWKFMWEQIQPVLDFIKNAIIAYIAIVTTVWGAIWNILVTAFNWIKEKIIQPIADTIKNTINTIWNILSPFIEKVKNAFNYVINGIKTGFESLKAGITSMFSSIKGIISAPVNGIIEGINKVLQKINGLTIPDWVPGLGGKSPNFKMIPKLNVGTNYVPEDTLAMIHKGEAVIPKKFNPYANGVDTSLIGNMNTNRPVNIIVNVDVEQDPLGQVVQKIKTFSGGAKNDYNYGMGGSRF